jgi:hypothetical protein
MKTQSTAQFLFSSYEHFRLNRISPINCKHSTIAQEMQRIVEASGGLLTIQQVGSSLEGRSINLIRCGTGKINILLWSQMHGDESTATLALMDIFAFLARRGSEKKWVTKMLKELTLCFIPMLNPDGAERRQRRTAQSIDMNRDARALRSPEARLLRSLQRKLNPRFGFNLHDQDLWSVGQSTNPTAIALLAPAHDVQRSVNPVRKRAMHVAATIAVSLKQFIDGHLATYDDAFEPRAFGDNMQALGTSTVLIESGHWPNDPGKYFIRKLNVVGILSALTAIGDGSYSQTPLSHYSTLVPNGKNIYDVIIRGIRLEHASGWHGRVDLGLSIEAKNNMNATQPVVTIKDIGDLSTLGALRTIRGRGVKVHETNIKLESIMPLDAILTVLGI